MKKSLLSLILILALFITGCAAPQGSGNGSNNIWTGVSGDTVEVTVDAFKMIIILNKDGSCSLSSIASNYMPATDYGDDFREFYAEMAGLLRFYGTYKAESGQIVMTLDNLEHYCLAVRGQDADAFKEAYLNYCETETPATYEYVKAAFEKGYTRSESEGTQTVTCKYESNVLTLLKIQNHDTAGVLVEESVINEDNSYVTTEYYADGTVNEVREYDTNNDLIMQTVYNSDGSLAYTEETTRSTNLKTTVRKDADGNVLMLHEHNTEFYDSGKRTTQRQTENGVVVFNQILDERNNGMTVLINETVEGDVVSYSIDVTGGIGDSEFYLYRQTEAGKLTVYQCSRYFPETEDIRYRSLRYNAETEIYELHTRSADGGENWTEIPASEYVPSDWEDPTDYQ